ncbi:MAG: class I SAM-dependent rRNA methyltransferase [Ignavibacteriales bacterium]
MNIIRNYAKVTITDKGKKHLDTGHPWVFEGEVLNIDGTYINGDLVDVISLKNKYLGTGFINDNSKIRVRIISKNANDKFDEKFWERRLKYAWEYRKTVMGDDITNCRIIFGEADQLPGLTIDRFNDILVAQCLSLGMDKIKDIIYNTIYKIMKEDNQNIVGLYERNDVSIRKLEGLEEHKGYYKLKNINIPNYVITTIIENGIKYKVDVENGQKTGFFLDQKYNRLAISKIAKGKKVLDCFTHTGSFAMNAAMGGSLSVHAVDISAKAIELAKENAELNNFSNITFEVADVFDLLSNIQNGEYDFIILDPPAFTKSSKTVENATRGYREINYRAIKILSRGGYLATCSCSHFMDDERFIQMLKEVAKDADVSLRQIEARQQGPDHPILWNVRETDYLKFYIFQII